jgi:catechol-2,3-dioxygenase
MPIRRTNHVVLSVSDLDKSTSFYLDVLGLKLVSVLPASDGFPEMRFFRAEGESSNHHDIALIPNATLPLPGWGQPRSPDLFHVAFEVGTLNELEEMHQRIVKANALIETTDQLMHLSVYAKDPDGLAVEIIWRAPATEWSYDTPMARRPLDFSEARRRFGADLATGSAAGEPA